MELYNGIKTHLAKERVSFHMPGHKGGKAYRGTAFENDLFLLDTTELSGTDCLHLPTDFILDAQNRAATLYGAKKTHFLVNGSTCGILALFYACFHEGDTVIVDRNCHKSVINAMMLVGVRPIYISPEYDKKIGIMGRMDAHKIEEVFSRHSEIKGVFITSPNYYGFCSELSKIAEIAHENGAILLVDEAHGAHFAFSNRFPKTAIEQGADGCVMSLHKTLPSPNQTALLHVGTEQIDLTKMAEAVNMFQTTSPSYPLLAFMDISLDYAEKNGAQRTEEILAFTKQFDTTPTDDPFKLILSFSRKGLNGYEVEAILREKFGIYAELADFYNVLLMVSWANDEQDFSLLRHAVDYIETLENKPFIKTDFDLKLDSMPCLTPKEAAAKQNISVPLDSSVGKINKYTITAFPPCIPVLLPGEIILKEHIHYIKPLLANQMLVIGIQNGEIQIVKE